VDRLKEIQRIIADKLGITPESVRPESKASDLQGWDSVNHIMIITDIEDTFDFKFGLEEIGEMNSVRKLLQAVESKSAS
jgi:acyl carrier protein